jgi:hypothetical protein
MKQFDKLHLKGELLDLFIKYQESVHKFERDEIKFSEVVNVGKELDIILKIK